MDRPFLIGIAGGSGSGKTTLARAVRDAFGSTSALRLEHDSYYRDLSELPPAARAEVNFDHPRALENELLVRHLDMLRVGKSIPSMRYDFATHTREPVVDVTVPRPVVVVEGILLLSVPELCSRFDLRVYVHTPPDLRFVRRLQRDVSERGRSLDSVCRQYLESVRPMHEEFVEPARDEAHVVVSGVGPLAEATQIVVAEVERRRREHVRQV